MPIVETRRQTRVVTAIDNATVAVPAGLSSVTTVDDIPISDYDSAVILVTAGTETANATLDAVFYVKDSNGNAHSHTAITQVTAAGSSKTDVAKVYGHTGKLVVTVAGDHAGDGFAGVTVEMIFKS